MTPRFSVVIPVYNRVSLVAETIESVQRQEDSDYELIVVDDGSTDGTWDLLQSLDPSIRVFRCSNGGPGAARNYGAERAKGEYLAFLDSDDLWFPWTLQAYSSLIREHSTPAFIVGKPFRFSVRPQVERETSAAIQSLHFADYYASGDKWRWWGASSFVVRRDAFIAAGGFTSEWVNGEDADLAMRLGDTPGFVQVLSPATFAYREHEVSAMKNFGRTLAGCRLKIQAEVAGAYPGGAKRRRERLRILSRHVRPVSIDCLNAGLRKDAWELYRSTFAWSVLLGRWKYLLGFPLRSLCS